MNRWPASDAHRELTSQKRSFCPQSCACFAEYCHPPKRPAKNDPTKSWRWQRGPGINTQFSKHSHYTHLQQKPTKKNSAYKKTSYDKNSNELKTPPQKKKFAHLFQNRGWFKTNVLLEHLASTKTKMTEKRKSNKQTKDNKTNNECNLCFKIGDVWGSCSRR